MDWTAVIWGAVVSWFAYWLGARSGWVHATRATASLLWHLGVRGVDSASQTITFRDGTTRTERTP